MYGYITQYCGHAMLRVRMLILQYCGYTMFRVRMLILQNTGYTMLRVRMLILHNTVVIQWLEYVCLYYTILWLYNG